MSARAHWGDVRAAPSLPNRVGTVRGYEASSNQSSPCGGSHAGANVVGVHGSPSAASTARAKGGVHHHGDHAATATARARQHVGGEHPAQRLGPRDPARAGRAARRRAVARRCAWAPVLGAVTVLYGDRHDKHPQGNMLIVRERGRRLRSIRRSA